MNRNWAEKEFGNIDLGNQRLSQRLIRLASNLSQSPEAPINQACGNWAETKAAYRFFKNETVNYRNISKSHIDATKDRCIEESTILAIQDTTFLTYSHHPKTKDLCALSKHKGKYKEIIPMGLVMHSTLAVSVDGLPLGLLDQKIYARNTLTDEKKKIKQRSHNAALPIEEKDSIRWLESLQKSHNLFGRHSTGIVTIGDRESDIYDLFRLGGQLESSILVRAKHNRTVNKKSRYSGSSGETLWGLMKTKKVQGLIKIKVSEKENQPARLATCEIKTSKFEYNPPRNHIGHKK